MSQGILSLNLTKNSTGKCSKLSTRNFQVPCAPLCTSHAFLPFTPFVPLHPLCRRWCGHCNPIWCNVIWSTFTLFLPIPTIHGRGGGSHDMLMNPGVHKAMSHTEPSIWVHFNPICCKYQVVKVSSGDSLDMKGMMRWHEKCKGHKNKAQRDVKAGYTGHKGSVQRVLIA